METGSSSEIVDKGKVMRGVNSKGKKQYSNGIKIEPFVPRSKHHNPKELRTWAKKTGFVSDYSGEAGTSASEKFDSVGFDVEKSSVVVVDDDDDQREGGSSPKIEIDPVLGVARPNMDDEIKPDYDSKHGARRGEKDKFLRSNYGLNETIGNQNQRKKNGVEPVLGYGDKKIGLRRNDDTNGIMNLIRDGNGHALGVSSAVAPMPEKKKEDESVTEGDVKVNLYAEDEEHAHREFQGQSQMNTSYLLWSAALPIIGWLISVNPISHGPNHGWNR